MLAVATAIQLEKNNHRTVLIDADTEHRRLGWSSHTWAERRQQMQPHLDCYTSAAADNGDHVAQIIDENMDARFIIIDCASRAAGTTLKLAAIADLTVFPIPTGEKDLQLSRNTIKAMFKGSERIPPLEPEQLAIVPTRAHTIPEWKASRQWLLDNCPHPERLVIHPPLLERPAYANAMSRGLAITETPYDDLSESARTIIASIIDQANVIKPTALKKLEAAA